MSAQTAETATGIRVAAPLEPSGLTVLYDADCPVCRRARRWAERQRQLVPLQFIPAGSDAAIRRFPHLDVQSTRSEVTVITDEGAVLRDDRAWIAVLWCVATTRSTAVQLLQGRRRRLFRSVKGATEAIRSIVADQSDVNTSMPSAEWPPPQHRGASDCAQPDY